MAEKKAKKTSRRTLREEISFRHKRSFILDILTILVLSTGLIAGGVIYRGQVDSSYENTASTRMAAAGKHIGLYASEVFSEYERSATTFGIISHDVILADDAGTIDSDFADSFFATMVSSLPFEEVGAITLSKTTYPASPAFSVPSSFIDEIASGQEGKVYVTVTSDSLCFAYPFQGQNVLGVYGSISKEFICENLWINSYHESATIVLLDQDGTTLVSASKKHAEEFKDDAISSLTEDASEEEKQALLASLSSGKTGVFTGPTYSAYYTPVNADNPKPTGTATFEGWDILVIVPNSEFTAVVSGLAGSSLAIIIVLIIALGVVGITLIVLESSRKNERLRLDSSDAPTGLLNLTRFTHDAEVLLRRHPDKPHSIIMAEINRYSEIIQRHGTDFTIVILQGATEAINHAIGKEGLACHPPGGKFLLFVPGDKDTAKDFAWKLWGELRQKMTELSKDNPYIDPRRVTFSLSVYECQKEDADDVGAAVEMAHFALDSNPSTADQLGRVVVFDNALHQEKMENDILRRQAAKALEHHHFQIYAQLKRNVQTDTWCGSEALVRWKDPERGVIPPSRFIPLFEEDGFVVQIDRFVLEEVCRKLSQQLKEGKELFPVSLNLSKRHFVNPDFILAYFAIIDRYRIPHHLIEFEVTESLAVEEAANIRSFIKKVHEFGSICAMDDFGNGFSSLNMLKEFDFDIIKLDGAFFHGREGFSEKGRKIVHSLLRLCNSLGKKIVAEGVERQEDADYLKLHHCEVIQGWLYSKPIPWNEAMALLYPEESKE